MKLVIDASVTVKWLFPDPAVEPQADQAVAILEGIRRGTLAPLQPPHWLIEVAAVISRLRPAMAERAIELLDAMELPIINDPGIIRRASRLAVQLQHHLFDTAYHALALEWGATLVTADRRYYRKARALGGVRDLTDWH
ncbi:type II toxin-antitoxin system VapC family toxin [Nitrococcus mobilis]|uniref:PIN domain-containing protein n=1 Tax=Nitrococcus mobilis Nb-231 TaxID=314278 RepID=A4BSM5_9GAMM|nr:type II toxin-antitoxin system VapC family toxin [Nitrococcus mobilis]EAR21295.1 hypothetical protein NB231_08560 [Nitrococcus mobilis Nb-231]